MDNLLNNKKFSIKYSKSSNDILKENIDMINKEKILYEDQKELTEMLVTFPKRKSCNCCGSKFKGVQFQHRNIAFKECSRCGHIQTLNKPPSNYLDILSKSSIFSKVYPKLNKKEFLLRRDRIYKPKLDWIFEVLNELGQKDPDLLNKRWVEIGSGAGYFLSAAKQKGISKLIGVESDEILHSNAVFNNPNLDIRCWKKSFHDVLNLNADIYCSFYVLEHIDELQLVWKKMREMPIKTIFVFSVPVFGFSCLLENSFVNQFGRNLGGDAHTQIFTDDSIEYAMELAGCEILSEWIFGQDISDLLRFINKDSSNNNKTKIHSTLNSRLNNLHDQIQALFDMCHLSDQRHFIATRK